MANLFIPISGPCFLVDIVVDNTDAVRMMMKKTGKALPDPVTVKALVDTGASESHLAPDLVAVLHLPAKNEAQMEILTAGGSRKSKAYYGSIRLKDEPRISVGYASIYEFDADTPFPFVAILGMNVLSRWSWSYQPTPPQGLTITVPDVS